MAGWSRKSLLDRFVIKPFSNQPREASAPTSLAVSRQLVEQDRSGRYDARMNEHASAIQQAADAIRTADALLIGAGAGMGVDSGLPDFRGNEGFWKAYPPFRGRRFSEMSNPVWFRTDPAQAWGLYGHRLGLYRSANPHDGFGILRRWAERVPHGAFVFTSNVDGQFQKAGFSEERIFECHGSVHYLQCVDLCSDTVWPAHETAVAVDETTFRAHPPLPTCPQCGGLARPNVLMFNDFDCLPERIAGQAQRYRDFLQPIYQGRIVALEIGAGTAIPTVRVACSLHAARLIRINPHDAEVNTGDISLPLGALDALSRIEALLETM
jgi:NAD-dependent SIR2 family protein deacetylase